MKLDTVILRLKDFIAKELSLDPGDIDSRTDLKSMGVDSLTAVKILLFAEKEFKSEIPDSELTSENFANIPSLAKCILKHSKTTK